MINVFLLVDASGSIVADDTKTVGAINEICDNVMNELEDADRVRIITYADKAKLYLDTKKDSQFLDFNFNYFGGRSNLGEAYSYVRKCIDDEGLKASEVAVLLVSDGGATDNYKQALLELDPHHEMTRIALNLGSKSNTSDKHVSDITFLFKTSQNDEERFYDEVSMLVN